MAGQDRNARYASSKKATKSQLELQSSFKNVTGYAKMVMNAPELTTS